MRVDYTEDVPRKVWEAFVGSSDHAYFFHTPLWADILAEAYRYRVATRLYEIDGAEILVPLMERRKYGVCMAQSMPLGYGGVFSHSRLSTEVLDAVLASMVGGRRLVFELTTPPFCDLAIRAHGRVRQDRSDWASAHVLPIDGDFEHLWKHRFSRHVRRGMQNADRAGVRVYTADDLASYRQFYSLYEQRSGEWGYTVPPHPWPLYECLQKARSPCVALRLAALDGTVVGGLVTFEYGDCIFGWSNASTGETQKYYPIYSLIRDLLEYACEHGFAYFNLGASGDLQGVIRFKEQFGARRVAVGRYRVTSGAGRWLLRMRPGRVTGG